MGGIPALSDFSQEQLVADTNETLAAFGLSMIVDFNARPTGTFWQRLRQEIVNRPRVFSR